MVSVLCGQRDRFRKRVTDLEEEVDQVKHFPSPKVFCRLSPSGQGLDAGGLNLESSD